jgi:hypothetical protein
MQIGSKIGTLNEHFVIFHHIFLVFVEKLTILVIIEATRVKLMKKKKKKYFALFYAKCGQNSTKTLLKQPEP